MQKRYLVNLMSLLAVIGLLFLLISNITGYHNIGVMVTYATLDEGTGFNTYIVANADPATFKDIGNGYATDKTHVYYQGIVISGADSASIKVIKEWGWSKDSKYFYAGNRRIQTCDADTFKFLTNDWQTDSKCVYRLGEKLQLADPNTFTVVNFWYGKDHKHVFFDSEIIEGADAITFHLLPGPCEVCARDVNRCYREKEVVSCEKFNLANLRS